MAAAPDHKSEVNWQEDVFRVLKEHNVKHVVYVPDALDIYQFSSTPQSCGRGRQDWISLTMRRSPRVNQEVLLRATFLG
jgi:hypothetical protein